MEIIFLMFLLFHQITLTCAKTFYYLYRENNNMKSFCTKCTVVCAKTLRGFRPSMISSVFF